MIATNESILVQTMINEGVSIKTIKKIYRTFKGWRIYFRGREIDTLDIIEDYEDMRKAGYTEKQTIKTLSVTYERTEHTMKENLKKLNCI